MNSRAHAVAEIMDDIKEKVTDSQYLVMMNAMQDLREREKRDTMDGGVQLHDDDLSFYLQDLLEREQLIYTQAQQMRVQIQNLESIRWQIDSEKRQVEYERRQLECERIEIASNWRHISSEIPRDK